MKKIVGTIAAAALVAASAFAEVGIGSWGRAIFSPVGTVDDGDTFVSNETTSWMGGKGTSRVGISVHGESENVGFNIDMNADGFSGAGIGDTAFFWAKPWDFLEVKIGKVQDDTGRGSLGYGMFNWWRMGFGSAGDDLTFTRFGNGGGGQARGAIVKITPVDGLWIIGTFDVDGNSEAAAVFGQQSQYGVGYTIDGIGSIRAQFIGDANAYNKDGDTIGNGKAEVAFDLTAVDNLYLTVGVQIPFAFNAFGKINDNISVGVLNEVKLAAGVDFKLAAVTLHAVVDGRIPNAVKWSEEFVAGINTDITATRGGRIGVGVGADVDFGNSIGLTADVRFQTSQDMTAKSTTTVAGTTITTTATETFNNSSLSFLVGLQKSLTNGMIGVGFEGEVQELTEGNASFNWAIPVVIQASF